MKVHFSECESVAELLLILFYTTDEKMQLLFIIGFSLQPEENKFPGQFFFLFFYQRTSVRLYSLRVDE